MRPLERIHSRSPFLGILRWNRFSRSHERPHLPQAVCATKYRCESELQRNFVARSPDWTAVSHDLPGFFPCQIVGTAAAFSTMVKLTNRRPAIPTKTANQLSSLLEGDDAGIFEIDRSNLVLQLRTLRRTINEGAEELDMVAIESVFVKSVSGALTRAANKLYLAAEDLGGLVRLVERAIVPKAAARPEPNRKPPKERKAPT